MSSSPASGAASALCFSESKGGRGAQLPLVVVLHPRSGDAMAAIAEARRMFGGDPDLIAPQAARPCNPFQSNLAVSGAYAGFSWYLGDDPALPEAASFGDVLAQLDLFVETQGRPFVLAGEGQGGALALALAIHAPARLVAVWAQAAALPLIEGWTRPHRDLASVEFALADWTLAARTAAEDLLVARGARIRMFTTSRASESAQWLQSLKITNTRPREERRGD